MPSTTVPLTKTPRAIRVALLAAPLASGADSPSIRTAWDVLPLAEVWFPPAALVSVFQLFTNCAHKLSSSSSLLFKTPGFCREPFPRHFLLSPSQSKITCKIAVVSPVWLCPGGGKASGGHSFCAALAACGASMSQELSSPPYQGFWTRAFHNVAEQMF